MKNKGNSFPLTVCGLLCVLLFNSASISAQTLQWQTQYNGSSSEMDEAVAVKTDASGNVYVTGTSKWGDNDIITIKYNAVGTPIWTVRYDEYFDSGEGGFRHTEDKATDLQIDALGNIYVSGTSYYEKNCNITTAITVKYNASGIKQWKVNTASSDCGATIDGPHSTIDASGNIYITESLIESGVGHPIKIDKISTVGALLWSRTYAVMGIFNHKSNAIFLDAASNVYIAGSIDIASGNSNYLTLKYNSAGTFQWQAQYNGPSGENDEAVAVKADASGNVYVTGTSKWGDNDMATVKYNAAGAQQWAVRYDEYYFNSAAGVSMHTEDKGTDLQIDEAGNVYVSGTSYFNNNCETVNALTLKYNSSGIKQWNVVTASTTCGPATLMDDPHSKIDASGNVHVTASYLNTALNIGSAIKTAKLSPAGLLLWSRTFTSQGLYRYKSNAMALNGSGNVYITGSINQDNGNYLTLMYAAQLNTRINGGGPALATSMSTFSADAYSTGATATGSSTAAIGATTDDALYQTYRRGNTIGGSFGYNIPVINGNYTVNLHFAELDFTTIGLRKFNVSAEGVAWLSNYDIVADGGVKTAKVKTKVITVTDGNLTLNFTSLVNYALVSAIEVIATPASSARESAESAEEVIVAEETQLQAYPNPFTDKVTISFSVPETSPAKLEVYNLQGMLVRRLFEGEAEGGKLYELEMDGSNLPNGLFISRLMNKAKTESKKIILSR